MTIHKDLIAQELLLIVVKVQVTQVGYEGRRDLALLYALPVYVFEEGVLLNVVYFQPRHRIVSEQQFYQFPSTHTHILREIQIAIPALLHDRLWILCFVLVLEGNEPTYHLANEDANAPYIRLIGVAHISHHDLRGAVAGRATVSVGSVRLNILHLFREAEVNNFYVAVVVDEDVLRLQIPVNNAMPMQLFHRQHYLCKIKP